MKLKSFIALILNKFFRHRDYKNNNFKTVSIFHQEIYQAWKKPDLL
jgi:hypothetical protein